LTKIRGQLKEVDSICRYWEDSSDAEEEERVEALIQRAFENSLVFMETIGRPDTRKHILTTYERAKKELNSTSYSVNAGEPYSIWSAQLSNVLDAVEKVQFQLANDIEEPLELIARILKRFVDVERALQHRRESRATLSIKDEYDIQDLLRSLLAIYFDGISAEEPGRKFVGASSRVDLLLRKERIAIEIKKTGSATAERSLGKELKVDIVDYKQRGDCDALVIAVDDSQGRLKNPRDLQMTS
jgi:tRNA threonylcarbamoyladenosine modification (KEOPS) complex  Pcc1 subunit